MLYPISNEIRAMIDLGGVWKFKLIDETELGERLPDDVMKDWELIAVPASYNDQKDIPEYRNHWGYALYQREVTVPACHKGQRMVLRFDAVTHRARVYLEGEFLYEHKGGFLPFEIDVTDRLEAGAGAVLTVAVDNRVDHSTLPVGNENGTAFFGSDNPWVPSVAKAKEWRKPQNFPNFDFFNYAGINRPVRLYMTPVSYVKDLTLVPDVNGTEGILRYQAEVEGNREEDLPVTVSILDADGHEAARGQGKEGVISVPDAKLWWPWPGDPYLYRAVVTYGADKYELSFGFRTVRVEGKKFLINGQPFYFKGFSKHEDSAFRGRGLDICLNVKDINLIHWFHANSFRTSHYPYAEEMYDLCDREGIVVIDETPAVGIACGPTQDPYQTLRVKEHHEQVLKELIDRDKNHPCVVMWSMGNEPDTSNFPESAYEYWRDLYQLTHSLDPDDRPVTFVSRQNDYTQDIVTRTMDVVCINRYYGWYNLSGDMDAACYALNLELDFWEETDKPVMMTEYGVDTIAGIHMGVPEMFSEEFQVEYYKRLNGEFDKRGFFIGEHAWNFADYGTLQGCMRVDGNKKGLLTRDRRPKMAAHYFRERWEKIPDFGYKE
ncbi:beta-glucuronidase [Lachnospiraceae bacterium 54-53]